MCMLTVAARGTQHGERMERVRITGVGVAHPPFRVDQKEAAIRVGEATGDTRRARAIARGSMIGQRATVLPAEELVSPGSIEVRNAIYREHAPALAAEAARSALCSAPGRAPASLVTSSCTGYALPGWSASLVGSLGLCADTSRVPLTEAGCAGGAVALTQAAHIVRSQGGAALSVAAELCTLSFHPDTDDDTLTANLIFGDGAGAALVEPGDGPGLEIIDSASFLVPRSEHALGFDLTDRGFRAVINRSLADIVAPHTKHAIERLLHRNGLDPCGVDAWLLHPGGARILHKVEAAFGIPKAAMQWSWDSLQEFGNTSSAAIFDVLRRYIDDPVAPRGWGVIAAFGPGVSIELLLVRSR